MNAANKLLESLGLPTGWDKMGKSRSHTKKGPGRCHANGALKSKGYYLDGFI